MGKWYDGLAPWAQPAPKVPDGVGEWEREAPARPADFVSDWLVPLAQAVTTGVLVGGLLAFGVAVLLPDLDADLLAVVPLQDARVLGLSSTALASPAFPQETAGL